MTKSRIFVPGQNGYRYNKQIADLIKDSKQRWIIDLGSDDYDLPGVLRNVAKTGDLAHLIMPDIGQKLLPFILPKKLRAAVAGDLAEDFHSYAAQWGRPYALGWLWWELAGLCIRRFGPTAIITAVGV